MKYNRDTRVGVGRVYQHKGTTPKIGKAKLVEHFRDKVNNGIISLDEVPKDIRSLI